MMGDGTPLAVASRTKEFTAEAVRTAAAGRINPRAETPSPNRVILIRRMTGLSCGGRRRPEGCAQRRAGEGGRWEKRFVTDATSRRTEFVPISIAAFRGTRPASIEAKESAEAFSQFRGRLIARTRAADDRSEPLFELHFGEALTAVLEVALKFAGGASVELPIQVLP
jgi:hypothetical protein